MNAERRSDPVKNPTTTERTSDREVTVTRTFNGPAHLVFQAWSKGDLFRQWWLPKSFGLTIQSIEMDARVGGSYKLVIVPQGGSPMEFFGRYTEAVPNSRLQWTNEEGGETGAITTVTFEERAGKTHVVISDLYPTKEALDVAMASSGPSCSPETCDQLEAFLGDSQKL